jgi:23S rRNA (pseudouridine1915-N3)-methyltransferase
MEIGMNITLITVGKIKEKYLKDAIAEYSKRLSRYCKLEILELQDEKTPDNASEKEELQIKAKEGDAILKFIKDNMYVVALAIDGKMLSSEELAAFIEESGIRGNSSIAFVIGGSLGLSKEVLSRADYKLSFSKMTFPHQLMRVILLEQVYRGFRINAGEPYHK